MYGWRVAFYAIGFPGILIAVCVLLIHNPSKGINDEIDSDDESETDEFIDNDTNTNSNSNNSSNNNNDIDLNGSSNSISNKNSNYDEIMTAFGEVKDILTNKVLISLSLS